MNDSIAALRDRIETALGEHLPTGPTIAPRLLDAMRYSTLAGGKRVRPLLVLATSRALGGSADVAIVPACALEYIHTYSLIHDDLPAMDNDILRRGKPTCHIAFDEATAILAGCGLLTHALQLLATAPHLDDATRIAITLEATRAAGSSGMLAGQSVDLASAGVVLDQAALEALHGAKTGELIRAAVHIGALCAGCRDADVLAGLDDFARALGLGFQVADDLLNVTGTTARLGKSVGSDAAAGKNTYPALLGIDGARAMLDTLHDRANAALQGFGNSAQELHTLVATLRERDH